MDEDLSCLQYSADVTEDSRIRGHYRHLMHLRDELKKARSSPGCDVVMLDKALTDVAYTQSLVDDGAPGSSGSGTENLIGNMEESCRKAEWVLAVYHESHRQRSIGMECYGRFDAPSHLPGRGRGSMFRQHLPPAPMSQQRFPAPASAPALPPPQHYWTPGMAYPSPHRSVEAGVGAQYFPISLGASYPSSSVAAPSDAQWFTPPHYYETGMDLRSHGPIDGHGSLFPQQLPSPQWFPAPAPAIPPPQHCWTPGMASLLPPRSEDVGVGAMGRSPSTSPAIALAVDTANKTREWRWDANLNPPEPPPMDKTQGCASRETEVTESETHDNGRRNADDEPTRQQPKVKTARQKLSEQYSRQVLYKLGSRKEKAIEKLSWRTRQPVDTEASPECSEEELDNDDDEEYAFVNFD